MANANCCGKKNKAAIAAAKKRQEFTMAQAAQVRQRLGIVSGRPTPPIVHIRLFDRGIRTANGTIRFA